jgi:hypothetical protein
MRASIHKYVDGNTGNQRQNGTAQTNEHTIEHPIRHANSIFLAVHSLPLTNSKIRHIKIPVDAPTIMRSLEDSGLRCTPQRFSVMSFLLDHHGHASTAENLLQGLRCPDGLRLRV